VDTPIYDSAKRPSPFFEEIAQVVRYRDLVTQLVRRDIVTRYKRSVLGIAWTMLNPLGMMLVLAVAFSQVFGAARAYTVYLLIGLVVWTFFAQTTVYAMRQLVWGGALIQRIFLPKTIFAVSATGTHLVNFLIALIPILIVMLANGILPQPSVIALPLALLCLMAFTLGLGLVLSTLAAYFPDVAEMYEIVLSAWMYLTPIIYPENIIPEPTRFWLFTFNPMYHIVKLFRTILYEGAWPSWEQWIPALLLALITLGIGWFVFTRKMDEFAYRI
jgi:ABC-2 type transport system permease protein